MSRRAAVAGALRMTVMVAGACVFAGLTLVEAKAPVLKFRKTIGVAGILVALIPLFLVLPQQLKAYYDQMTESKKGHFFRSVTDTVSGSVDEGGALSNRALHFCDRIGTMPRHRHFETGEEVVSPC
jgi:hypothetical protein